MSVPVLKGLIHLFFIVYFVSLWALALLGRLNPNPAEVLIDQFGLVAMYALVVCLASPLIKRGFRHALRFRKQIGLYSFFFASFHFVFVLFYEMGFSWQVFFSETLDKPFIWLGVIAWLSLLPVAITSLNYLQRRLGKTWKRIHQLVYLSILGVVIHYVLQLRGEWLEFVVWLIVLLLLLVEKLNRLGVLKIKVG